MPLGAHAARYAKLINAGAPSAGPPPPQYRGENFGPSEAPTLDRLSALAGSAVHGLAAWGRESIDAVAGPD